MNKFIFASLFFLLVSIGCDNPESPVESEKAPAKPQSLDYNYTIKEIDFKNNHKLRVENKENINKITNSMRDMFIDKTKTSQDKSYKEPDELLARSTSDLENILNNNKFIGEAFKEYKVNSYLPMNKMLREGKYFRPVVGAAADCTADPRATKDFSQQHRNFIHCIDLAYEKRQPKTANSTDKTILFRTIVSDQNPEFEGLKFGCFNPGQQKFIDDLAFGSTTTSFSAALNHHDNIKRDYNKKTYADSIYKSVQNAIILMIEVDANDPVFKFPKSLDTGTQVTVEEKEVLLKRGFKLEFSCKPNEFLPEIPNEFEYIPNFKADATSPTDYKIYRVIRAKLVYPKS